MERLLIAALAHGTYNTLVGVVPHLVTTVTGIGWPVAFIGFVIAYDGILGYILYRKISRYRTAYRETNGDPAVEGTTPAEEGDVLREEFQVEYDPVEPPEDRRE